MTFSPALPLGGLPGWAFLTRTGEAQRTALAETAPMKREAEAFRQRIGSIRTAEALVADRTLLKVALGAFGLEGDLNSRAFLRRVLESPAGDAAALANRLADPRYRALSRAFAFAEPGGPATGQAGFADRILRAYQERQFESAVGRKDESLRLALNARRELEALAARGMTEDGAWFAVMGQRPLRQVFETALGLPASFGRLDVDRQKEVLRDRTARALGDGRVAQFADPARREELIRLYLLRAQVGGADASTSGQSAALSLLSARVPPRP